MKHTLEEKRDIVRQIKRGRPLSSLCKTLHLDCHMVRDWLLRYEKYGDQGLRIRTPKYHFNTQEKERIIWEHTKKRKINRRIENNEKNKTKTEGEMPKTEYQFASVAKRYGSGLLTRISRVRITSGALQDKS